MCTCLVASPRPYTHTLNPTAYTLKPFFLDLAKVHPLRSRKKQETGVAAYGSGLLGPCSEKHIILLASSPFVGCFWIWKANPRSKTLNPKPRNLKP